MILRNRKLTETGSAVLADDEIDVDTTAGAVTVTLLSTMLQKKKAVIVKDLGYAGTNNVTIVSEGGELFDGASSYTLNINYSAIWCTPNEARTAWNLS